MPKGRKARGRRERLERKGRGTIKSRWRANLGGVFGSSIGWLSPASLLRGTSALKAVSGEYQAPKFS